MYCYVIANISNIFKAVLSKFKKKRKINFLKKFTIQFNRDIRHRNDCIIQI